MIQLLETLAFTGTREGMTDAQKKTVVELIAWAKPAMARHGDCVGSDADFHTIMRGWFRHIPISIHPPTNARLRARCMGGAVVPPKPYLERNREMVDGSRYLIATPKESTEQAKGGTWHTVRYAAKQGRQVFLVWPDGGYWEYYGGGWNVSHDAARPVKTRNPPSICRGSWGCGRWG